MYDFPLRCSNNTLLLPINTITMLRLVTILFTSLAAVTLAQYGAYHFPIDYEFILQAPLVTSFSCEGRPYGYYADQENNCQIFHVCFPEVNDLGETVRYHQWSFICGNATIFSQQSLSCTSPEDAFPCDQADTLYELVNSEFGVIPEEQQIEV